MEKCQSEIQEEIDDPHTKALIIAPVAKNAYLLDRVTINFPAEIPSVLNGESITLKGKMDIIKRRALVGLMIFPAHNDPDMAERIDEFVEILQEADGEKLDYLAPEFVQDQFRVGNYKSDVIERRG